MLNVFILVLLLIYFWYFYYSDSKPMARPTVPGPQPPSPFQITYKRLGLEEFEFNVNGRAVWSEKVPSYLVTGDQIQEIDDCFYTTQNGQKVPAQGLGLYHFVKKNPSFQSLVQSHTKKDNDYISRHGTPFYFTCDEKKISNLTLCAPGSIFQNGHCKAINSCTGHRNGMRLPYINPHQWIECQDGEERIQTCELGKVFYGGSCVSATDRLCVLQKNLDFFKFDEVTLLGCQNHTPVYKTCPPGTRLFDSTVCEPDDCFGKGHEEKIPLRKRKRTPFEYSPGYSICRRGKIAETVECPQVWDPFLANEENLTMLPMVYDARLQTCSVPSLCENVWPIDQDVYVQKYKFTRNIQNWPYSRFYDQGIGYRCDPVTGKKTQHYVQLSKRINDHFRLVPLCNENDPSHVPVPGHKNRYYDCQLGNLVSCNAGQYFNGSQCQELPAHTQNNKNPIFWFENIPFFQFDQLNANGWIQPHTKHTTVDMQCDPGFEYVKLYQICSDPLCKPYAFLSMIPELSLFLPRTERAKCKYDDKRFHLQKEETSLNYTFWDQRVLDPREKVPTTETCQFSQNLKTGNFIWDKTVYATCDLNQPFVFCPSKHTKQILNVEKNDHVYYACAPPSHFTTLRHPSTPDHINYGQNQFRRILRVNNRSTSVQMRKGDPFIEVPKDGLEIPDNMRLNLKSLDEVDLEYKYRVTYPPNVVFEYTDSIPRIAHVDESPTKVFNIKSQQFEHGKFKFPKYKVLSYSPDFQDKYDP